ncbi:hypothetical protein X777_07348, partial [Ooceraea biroi]
GRGSRRRKGTIADQTEWSKTRKSTMAVSTEVIFRASDPTDSVYFEETLPPRLRRRYVGPLRRYSLRVLPSPFSLFCFLHEDDIGGAVHFTDLLAPSAEFDVRDNIEALGDSSPSEWISHLGPSPGAAGRFRARGESRRRSI